MNSKNLIYLIGDDITNCCRTKTQLTNKYRLLPGNDYQFEEQLTSMNNDRFFNYFIKQTLPIFNNIIAVLIDRDIGNIHYSEGISIIDNMREYSNKNNPKFESFMKTTPIIMQSYTQLSEAYSKRGIDKVISKEEESIDLSNLLAKS